VFLRPHFVPQLNPVKMAQVISNSGHDDMIHDAVLDYYGRRLATCSSDKTIKIFEIEGESQRLTETLKGYGNISSLSLALRPHPLIYPSQSRGRRLVCIVGASQVWQHPRLRGLRRQGLHLARAVQPMAKDLRLCTAQGICQHGLMVTP
jgi:hypothetical protein